MSMLLVNVSISTFESVASKLLRETQTLANLQLMRSAREILTDGLRELEDAAAQIQLEIGVLRTSLGQLEATTGLHESGVTTAPESQAISRPVREIALDVVRANGIATLPEIIDAVRAAGNDARPESISSMLSRLKADNLIDAGPRRGTYQLTAAEPIDELSDSDDEPYSSSISYRAANYGEDEPF